MEDKVKSSLRTSEAGGLLENSLNSINQLVPAEQAEIIPIKTEIEAMLAELTEVNKKDLILSDLKELDAKCDITISGISYYLKAFATLEDSTISASANTLLSIFEKYGNQMSRKSMDSQLSEERGLLSDFDKPENAVHINALPSFSVFVDQLKTNTNNFAQRNATYKSLIAEQRALPTATDVKSNVSHFFNNRFRNFLAYFEDAMPDVYGALARAIQKHIDDLNENIKRRKTLAEKEETPNNDRPNKEENK